MHCAILPIKDKSPLNLLFYKPPTSAHNILIIVKLGLSFSVLFAMRSCQTLDGVKLYPSKKNISTDDGEYTGNISQFYEPC